MGAARHGGPTGGAAAMGNYHWTRAGSGLGAVTWALAGGGAWLLIAVTADGADQPVPVAAGLLLGLVLGQATVVELVFGMAGAALVSAVDPLDVAAAVLSVLMAGALVVAVFMSVVRAPPEKAEEKVNSFI